jgi:hypothetical protein
MSQDFQEGGLTFQFPDSWKVCRAEKSEFYVKKFQNLGSSIAHGVGCQIKSGSKEMDLVAYDPAMQKLWLIEVKDFRHGGWTKSFHVIDQLVMKARDVMSLFAVAAIVDIKPNDPPPAGEGQNWQAGEFARALGGARKLKIVFHCELSPAASAIIPNRSHQANLLMKLRQRLSPLDHDPVFADGTTPGLPWQVV